jgi:hypothetical protein
MRQETRARCAFLHSTGWTREDALAGDHLVRNSRTFFVGDGVHIGSIIRG